MILTSTATNINLRHCFQVFNCIHYLANLESNQKQNKSYSSLQDFTLSAIFSYRNHFNLQAVPFNAYFSKRQNKILIKKIIPFKMIENPPEADHLLLLLLHQVLLCFQQCLPGWFFWKANKNVIFCELMYVCVCICVVNEK